MDNNISGDSFKVKDVFRESIMFPFFSISSIRLILSPPLKIDESKFLITSLTKDELDKTFDVPDLGEQDGVDVELQ